MAAEQTSQQSTTKTLPVLGCPSTRQCVEGNTHLVSSGRVSRLTDKSRLRNSTPVNLFDGGRYLIFGDAALGGIFLELQGVVARDDSVRIAIGQLDHAFLGFLIFAA